MLVNPLRVHVVQSYSRPGQEFQYTKCDFFFFCKAALSDLPCNAKARKKKNSLEPSEHFVSLVVFTSKKIIICFNNVKTLQHKILICIKTII